jgi:hypothetical protein
MTSRSEHMHERVQFYAFHTVKYIATYTRHLRGSIQKFPDRLPGARTENSTALCH